jgi:hypothetical protein
MAAKLQAMGYEAFFYEPAAGGHGYGKDHLEQATVANVLGGQEEKFLGAPVYRLTLPMGRPLPRLAGSLNG